jgi:hypothetical protein
VPRGRGFYICLLSESNGPNLLDEFLNDFIWFLVFGNGLPMHLEIMTHSESYTSAQSFKKTGILAVPMDTGGLEIFTDS